MKVYVNGNIDESAYKRLAEKTEVISDIERIDEFDAMLIKGQMVTRDMIAKAKNLKVISRHGVGCDMIDLEAAKEYHIPVMNVPGGNAESVAELAVSFMMALSRHVKYFDQGLQSGLFEKISHRTAIGLEMKGKTLAIVGTGSIAQLIAEMMQNAFQMRVFAYSPHLTLEKAQAHGWEKFDDIHDMFAQADYISINVPLTEETRSMIGSEEFAAMKKTAIFVNTARGAVVQEDALYEALKDKKIWGAASDVFCIEPPKPDNPLLMLNNFIATPHMGSSTYESMKRCGNIAVDHIFEVLGIVG